MRTLVRYSDKAYLCWENNLAQFRVTRPFDIDWYDRDGERRHFRVPRGFLTDLASIPKAFRSIISQIGHHIQPAVVHDWLYEFDEGFTRLEADQLFFDGMFQMGVPFWKRNVMYQAVRIGGGPLWG